MGTSRLCKCRRMPGQEEKNKQGYDFHGLKTMQLIEPFGIQGVKIILFFIKD
jgi:hypothetical protein